MLPLLLFIDHLKEKPLWKDKLKQSKDNQFLKLLKIEDLFCKISPISPTTDQYLTVDQNNQRVQVKFNQELIVDS